MCLGLLALFPSPGLSPCSGELLANAETLHRVLARAEVWAPREPSQEHVPEEGAGSVRPRTPRSPPRRSHTRHKRESQLTETGEPRPSRHSPRTGQEHPFTLTPRDRVSPCRRALSLLGRCRPRRGQKGRVLPLRRRAGAGLVGSVVLAGRGGAGQHLGLLTPQTALPRFEVLTGRLNQTLCEVSELVRPALRAFQVDGPRVEAQRGCLCSWPEAGQGLGPWRPHGSLIGFESSTRSGLCTSPRASLVCFQTEVRVP